MAQYQTDPVGADPGAVGWFDAAVSQPSTNPSTTLSLQDCQNSSGAIDWYNTDSSLAADGVALGWNPLVTTLQPPPIGTPPVAQQPIQSGLVYSNTSTCQTWTFSQDSIPSISELTGTVFAVAAPTISGVTFTKAYGVPVLTITGEGLGTAPTPVTPPSCDTTGGDDYYYDDLYVQDFTQGWIAGDDTSCIGLIILSYTGNEIQLAVPTNDLLPRDQYNVVVTPLSPTDDFAQFSGSVSYMQITTASLPTGEAGVKYSATLSATGGNSPYKWSVVSGSLPPGLKLKSTGVISGKPKNPGAGGLYDTFTVQAIDKKLHKQKTPQNVATKKLSITINPVSGFQAATALAAGGDHSCAALSGGTVDCWGDNSNGQLGDGNTTNSSTPVTVSGLTGVTALSAGHVSSCALRSTGTVDCWGFNGDGDLGDGTTTNSSTPVAVTGLSGVTAIATQGDHSCALLTGGTVDCWGDNVNGELGIGTTTGPDTCGTESCSTTPVAVPGLSGVTAIAAGNQHFCALLFGGTVECWGWNDDGQLGNGTTTDSPSPVPVSGLSGVTTITAGYEHTCAVLSAGTVDCWGYNADGELGNGSTTNSSTPVAVSGIGQASAIAAGAYHSCALLSTGTVDCWGYNGDGELGNGSTTSSSTPVEAGGISGVTSIASGDYYSCALLSGGTVDCWGYNDNGQLGNGTTTNSSTPVPVVDLP